MLKALVLESRLDMTVQLASLFESKDFIVRRVSSPEEAIAEIGQHFPDLLLVVIDDQLPDWTAVFENNELSEVIDTILIDKLQDEKNIAAGMRLSVTDYFTLPLNEQRLAETLDQLREEAGQEDKDDAEQAPLNNCGRLLGHSQPMLRLYRILHKVAPTEVSVFLQGESGVGKELVAEAIHGLSAVADGPFIAVNCAAISPQLLESELFGHVKGAFTGANRSHTGYFERAEGGTIFLDEITELDIELQVKLLRVLESHRFTKVGGERDQAMKVRVLAATNRKPKEAIVAGKLREDLYYRLAQFPIRVPPLRERGHDVVLLARSFLAQLNREYEAQKTLTKASVEAIRIREWPGNVRELKNAINQAFILADQEISPEHIPVTVDFLDQQLEEETVPGAGAKDGTPVIAADGGTIELEVGHTLEDAEKALLYATLLKTRGDKTKTAELMGVSVKTIYNMIKRHGTPLEEVDL